MEINKLTALELREKLDNKELSSVEITKHYLDRIKEDDKKDDKINAFISTMDDKAIANAKEADKKIVAGDKSPLLGIPVAIKDNMNIKDENTTCGSKMLKNYKAVYNATAIENLIGAGAIFHGKTNMDEFAMGSSTETSYYGIVRNPVDRSCIPGGSSGGSAAAIAGGFAPLSLGSDTGGSIRQPASLCGVVGLKPTYGRVSRYGLVAFASSLDQIGPFSKTVADSALLLNSISSYDHRDSTSIKTEKEDFTKGLDGDLNSFKIGLPKEYFDGGMDPAVEKIIEKRIADVKAAGAEIIEVSLPHTKYSVPVYYIIATAEASANLSRFDGIRYGFRDENASSLQDVYFDSRGHGFGAEVKRRIMLGTYVLSSGYYDAYYLKAQKARTLIKKDFDEAFKKVDAILTPTSPTVPFRIGEKSDDPISMYLSDIYTTSANIAGIPGISIPAGNDESGLPVGLQLMAKPFAEHNLLKIAHRMEKIF